ncbi:hypothetical protein INR49_018930 [Caranx melampygus]|nr:hypothetical protein INR49_018930 [Caranx melampygus]
MDTSPEEARTKLLHCRCHQCLAPPLSSELVQAVNMLSLWRLTQCWRPTLVVSRGTAALSRSQVMSCLITILNPQDVVVVEVAADMEVWSPWRRVVRMWKKRGFRCSISTSCSASAEFIMLHLKSPVSERTPTIPRGRHLTLPRQRSPR